MERRSVFRILHLCWWLSLLDMTSSEISALTSLNINNFSFSLKNRSLNNDLLISNIFCYGLQFDDIISDVTGLKSVNVLARGSNLTCRGQLALHKYPDSDTSTFGQISFRIKDYSFDAIIRIIPGPRILLSPSPKIGKCNFNINFDDIEVKIIGAISLPSDFILKHIHQRLPGFVCEETSIFFESLPILLSSPATSLSPSNISFVNWQNNTLLKLLDQWLDLPIIELFLKVFAPLGEFSFFNTTTFFTFNNISIGISSVNISGLNSLNAFDILEPVDSSSLRSQIGFKYLNYSIDIFIKWNNDTTTIHLANSLDNFLFNLTTRLLIIQDAFKDIRVGQLFNQKCLFSAVHELNVTELGLSMKFLPDFDAMESTGPDNSFPRAIWTKMLENNEMNGFLQQFINEQIAAMIASIPPTPIACATPAIFPSPTHYVDWSTSKFFQALRKFLNFIDMDGNLALNQLVDIITNKSGTIGDISIGGTLISVSTAKFNLTIGDMILKNLDSFNNMDVLIPSGLYSLASSMELGGEDPNSFDIAMHVKLKTGEMPYAAFSGLDYDVNASLNLDGFLLSLDMFAKDNMGVIYDLKFPQLTNGYCWMSSMEKLLFSHLNISMIDLGASIEIMPEAIWIEVKDLGQVNLPTPVFDLITKIINYQSKKNINISPYHCAGIPIPDPTPDKKFIDTLAARILGGAAVICAIGLSTLAMLWFVWGPEKEMKIVQPMGSPLLSVKNGAQVEPSSHSLLCSPNLHVVVKYSVLLLILGSFVLFLAANFSVGAEVDLFVSSQETFFSTHLFRFSLGNSVREMWTAQDYALSILIAAFSGGWPYVKLLFMFGSWIIPQNWKILYPARRERMLVLLDALGKWSLIDAMVMSLMMVSFRFHIGPGKDIGQGGKMAFDVIAEPGYGYFGFVIAVIVSLVLSHVILFCHRYDQGVSPMHINSGGQSIALHKYSVPLNVQRSDGQHSSKQEFTQRFNGWIKWLVPGLLLTVFIFLISGSLAESFHFTFGGSAGLVLGDKSQASYSVISLGNQLPLSSRYPTHWGVQFMQISFYLFVLVLPLAHIFTMAILWLTPLSLKKQYSLFVIAEVLNAWSSVEVLMSGLLAAVLQIETFAEFLVGDMCDQVNGVTDKLLGIDKCFQVVAGFGPGIWVLLVAAVLSVINSNVVMHVCHKALGERMIKNGYSHMAAGIGYVNSK